MNHTVAINHSFMRAAQEAGMNEEEIERFGRFPVGEPDSRGGGCRKVRIAGRGKGKSGGYRTITFYSGEQLPVFLITVFSKGERSDLSRKETNQLRDITKEIVAAYRGRVAKPARKGA
jgi:hypothetical protein